ncbi:MAG: PIN domain-containing protein [Atopobiaceae bacterium]|nr:PIN domain-containing protein [Atopobiaceae bacterium]
MSFEGARIVVDTCVWIDNYFADKADEGHTREFLRVAQAQGAQLLFAVHAAKDVLYILTQKFKIAARISQGSIDDSVAQAAYETALACTRNMYELATAVAADVSDIWIADKYLRIHNDFEDNLVLAACKRSKADYLVTTDQSLIAHADVLAKTPAEMLSLMALEF